MTETVHPAETIANALANAIETLLNDWPTAQHTAKVTLNMTEEQWTQLLDVLRAIEPDQEP